MQHAPNVHVTVPLDIEDQIRIALQQPALQPGQIKFLCVSGRTCRRMAADRPIGSLHGVDEAKGSRLAGLYRVPGALRGKSIGVTMSPFGPKVLFGRNGLKEVGRLGAVDLLEQLGFRSLSREALAALDIREVDPARLAGQLIRSGRKADARALLANAETSLSEDDTYRLSVMSDLGLAIEIGLVRKAEVEVA
jgi:hypothetical protein